MLSSAVSFLFEQARQQTPVLRGRAVDNPCFSVQNALTCPLRQTVWRAAMIVSCGNTAV